MHTARCPWHTHVAGSYQCRSSFKHNGRNNQTVLLGQHTTNSIVCSATAPPSGADSTWAKNLLSATVKKKRRKPAQRSPSDDTFRENDAFIEDATAYDGGDTPEPTTSYAPVTNRNYKRKTQDRPVIIKTVEPEEKFIDPEDLDFEDFDDFDEDDDRPADFEGTHNKLPSEVRCFDTAKICLRSGNGGNGCVAFRREKFVEKGGPAGGDGGRGGNVWAVVDTSQNSLLGFRKQVHWRAENGIAGKGSQCKGADAPDLLIPVPPGTIIRLADSDPETEPALAELLKAGDKALLLAGGRGGRGNASFKTNKNRAPVFAENGEEGFETWVELELKLVADVGIIGVPNAGKSTFLAGITAAKPKIANYPFTTLVPNLGVCELDYKSTVFADVPGLMEGAHEGLGLGHEFLRHVQRCRALVHVVDGTSPDPLGDFHAINLELELFNPELKDKPQVVAYNKIDLPDSGAYWEDVREELLASGIPPENMFAISAATKDGVWEVVRRVRHLLEQLPAEELKYTANALNRTTAPRVHSDARLDDFRVHMEDRAGVGRVFVVRGEAVERFAQMTNWDYYEAIKRFQRVMDVAGITASLQAAGVKEGDSVEIGVAEFTWSDDRSEGALYDAFMESMKGRARVGSASWPKPFES